MVKYNMVHHSIRVMSYIPTYVLFNREVYYCTEIIIQYNVRFFFCRLPTRGFN